MTLTVPQRRDNSIDLQVSEAKRLALAVIPIRGSQTSLCRSAVLIAYSAKLQFKLQAGELFQRALMPAEISMKRRSRSTTWNHL